MYTLSAVTSTYRTISRTSLENMEILRFLAYLQLFAQIGFEILQKMNIEV